MGHSCTTDGCFTGSGLKPIAPCRLHKLKSLASPRDVSEHLRIDIQRYHGLLASSIGRNRSHGRPRRCADLIARDGRVGR
ncbi:MAG: hypothetical protein JWN03_8469 [Nocardia sp.]|nr:hypothetical protein [Nocardia sp.]